MFVSECWRTAPAFGIFGAIFLYHPALTLPSLALIAIWSYWFWPCTGYVVRYGQERAGKKNKKLKASKMQEPQQGKYAAAVKQHGNKDWGSNFSICVQWKQSTLLSPNFHRNWIFTKSWKGRVVVFFFFLGINSHSLQSSVCLLFKKEKKKQEKIFYLKFDPTKNINQTTIFQSMHSRSHLYSFAFHTPTDPHFN